MYILCVTTIRTVHDLYNDIHTWWSDYNAHKIWCYATHMCRCAIYCTGQHSTMLCVHYSLTTFYYKGREPYKQLLRTVLCSSTLSLPFPFLYSWYYGDSTVLLNIHSQQVISTYSALEINHQKIYHHTLPHSVLGYL